MQKAYHSQGFTLIELLVVIAIIGILSSVVLSSLSSARVKAYDTKVQAQLSHIRNSAEIYFLNNGNYGVATSSCSGGMFIDTTSGMVNLTKSVNYPVGENTIVCSSKGTSYAVSDNISASSTYWCVDSSGASKQEVAPLSTTTTPAACA